jgi:eukaryotic translation initiation factor 2C
VTSIVYSWDRYATKYAAATGIQHPRQEIIDNFKNYIKVAISNFVRVNGVPQCIFFFRDGVSEGEYSTVVKEEKDQLQGIIVSFTLLLSG